MVTFWTIGCGYYNTEIQDISKKNQNIQDKAMFQALFYYCNYKSS